MKESSFDVSKEWKQYEKSNLISMFQSVRRTTTVAMEKAGASDGGKSEDAGAVDIGDVGGDSGDRRRRGRSKHFRPGAVVLCLATTVVVVLAIDCETEKLKWESSCRW
ncbi:hypothetical protein L2E82_37381 [Cichorium intybus]|uniref:Uncharacterized protein n=1 Tax=Cichorium intybus TaxID=13427 RepID=A0ACB9AFD8_CICIN|nr:hypothetical protein L2E82_37381 [Cichorium intybus]